MKRKVNLFGIETIVDAVSNSENELPNRFSLLKRLEDVFEITGTAMV